jgi:catechol-2,3-dioxygenase
MSYSNFLPRDAQRRQRLLPLFVDKQVPINRCVSHGNTVSIYANDPDGNSVEVYCVASIVPQPSANRWTTKSEVEIRTQLNQILTEWASQST